MVMYDWSHGVGCGEGRTWEICTKPLGNTEQGVCNMTGNVSEWVQDMYHNDYNGAPDDGSAWEDPDGVYRVVRGGNYQSVWTDPLHSTSRGSGSSGSGYSLGFRCAR
jgi:formylglycine-generating enzyme required for sulfatase activity